MKNKQALFYFVLYAILIGGLTLFYSLLSGPAAEYLGLKELLTKGSQLSREGRIIIVYHALAVPFLSLLATLILGTLNPEEKETTPVFQILFLGSVLSSLGGLIFSYFSGGMLAHGLFITGLSLVFGGGVFFLFKIISLSPDYFSIPLEKVSILILTISILFSAAIGGAIGSYFGSGFQAVLAEDIIKKEHNIFERALISHLHIMVALVAASVLYLLTRYFGFYLKKNKYFYYLFLTGTVITSISTWSVIAKTLEKQAHKVINVGAFMLIMASFIYAYSALKEFVRVRKKRFFELVSVIYLIAVNFVVTIPGIYVAINLEKFRQENFSAIERSFAVGHWHVLASTCALIIASIFFDAVGVSEKKLLRTISSIAFILILFAFMVANLYMFTKSPIYLSLIEVFLAPGLFLFFAVFASAIYLGFKKVSFLTS